MNLFGAKQHDPDVCQCLVSGSALAVVRKVSKVSFEAIASGSDYSVEYLEGVERGDEGKCGDLKVVDAYEQAMGTPMETALAIFNTDLAQVALQVNRMIHRLGERRKAEAGGEEQPPGTGADRRAGTADGGQSGDAGGVGHAPAEGDGNGA